MHAHLHAWVWMTNHLLLKDRMDEQCNQHSPWSTSNHRSIDSSQDLHGVAVLLLMLEVVQSQNFGLGGKD